MGSTKNSNYNKIMGDEDFILNEIKRKHTGRGSSDAFLRAGPRAVLHFEPTKVRAAVVTCGGLCPGLNSVIRELVHSLYYNYGAEAVIGIRFVLRPLCHTILFCVVYVSMFNLNVFS